MEHYALASQVGLHSTTLSSRMVGKMSQKRLTTPIRRCVAARDVAAIRRNARGKIKKSNVIMILSPSYAAFFDFVSLPNTPIGELFGRGATPRAFARFVKILSPVPRPIRRYAS